MKNNKYNKIIKNNLVMLTPQELSHVNAASLKIGSDNPQIDNILAFSTSFLLTSVSIASLYNHCTKITFREESKISQVVSLTGDFILLVMGAATTLYFYNRFIENI